MTNDEIVKALPQLKDLKIDLRIVEDQIKGLSKQREQLQHEIKTLEGVDRVIDGIAVHETDLNDRDIYGKTYNIGTVAYELSRSAQVYTNANTKTDWGIHLYWRDEDQDRRGEKWLMTGWAFKDAVEVARRWVVHKEVPSEDQQHMMRHRHALDPKGHATKRRRAAYEAAWIAGHQDLAKEILLGRAKAPKRTKKAA